MSDDDATTDGHQADWTDLDRAELVESAGLQNAVAVGNPIALLAWPLTWSIGWVRRQAQRVRRSS